MSDCTRFADDLKALVDGELSLVRRWMIERHVAGCETCKGEVAAMEQIGRGLRLHEPVPLDAALRARIVAAIPESSSPARRPMPRRLSFVMAGSVCAIAALVVVFRPATTSFVTTAPSAVMSKTERPASAPMAAASGGEVMNTGQSRKTMGSPRREPMGRTDRLKASGLASSSNRQAAASMPAPAVPPLQSNGRAKEAAEPTRAYLRPDVNADAEKRNAYAFDKQRGAAEKSAESQPSARYRASAQDFSLMRQLPRGQSSPDKPAADAPKTLGALPQLYSSPGGGSAALGTGVAANGAQSRAAGGGFGGGAAGGSGGGGTLAGKPAAQAGLAGPTGTPPQKDIARYSDNRQQAGDDRLSFGAARQNSLADGNQGVSAPGEPSQPMSAVLGLAVSNVPEKRAAVDKIARDYNAVKLYEQLADKHDTLEEFESVLKLQVEPVKFYKMLDQLGKLGEVTTKLLPDPEQNVARTPVTTMDTNQRQLSTKEQEDVRRVRQEEAKREVQLRAAPKQLPAQAVGGRGGGVDRAKRPLATITVKLKEKRTGSQAGASQGAASQSGAAPAGKKR